MGKLGDEIYSTETGDRIFIGPGVDRYEREDGGEVIVVRDPEEQDSSDDSDE